MCRIGSICRTREHRKIIIMKVVLKLGFMLVELVEARLSPWVKHKSHSFLGRTKLTPRERDELLLKIWPGVAVPLGGLGEIAGSEARD